jgi:hypothetical protein
MRPLGPDDYLLLCHLTLAPMLALAGGVAARTFAGHPPAASAKASPD